MISIILIEPETAGNVGAVARVMSNFDFFDLVVINPKCDILSKESEDRATHAKDILRKAKIYEEKVEKALKKFDILIATTARLGTDYNILRSPLTPSELSSKLAEIDARKSKSKIGIVFGRESKGLFNDEVAMCDFSVTIPASRKFNSLNLSHSVAVILYELSKEKDAAIKNKFPLAGQKEKELLLQKIDAILDTMEFAAEEKKETQRKLWKKLVGKSMLTKRESQALFGFLKKLNGKK